MDMKKVLIFTLSLCLAALFAFPAMADGNYPSTNASWDATASIDDEGNVIVSFDPSKVSGLDGAYQYAYIAVYNANQNFNADSNMLGAETDKTPFRIAQAGPGGVGAVENGVYKVTKGGDGAANSGSFPFEEGKTYYFYICASDNAGWVWNYKPVIFTYNTSGDPAPTPGKDGSGNTGDFSIIAYAVAAITAGGALVTLKRK